MRRTNIASERGQIIVLVAIMMVVLIGGVGLAVDLGVAFVDARRIQNAVDAAAIAGASYLPTSPEGARAAVDTYLEANDFDPVATGHTVSATTPYNGAAQAIEVVATTPHPTAFMRVLGIDTITIQRRAVAKVSGFNGVGSSILALNTDCGESNPLRLHGAGGRIDGGVHSNSRIEVDGDGNRIDGPVTYVCSASVPGSGNVFGSGPSPSTVRTSPITKQYSDFPCTVTYNRDVDIELEPALFVGGNPSSGALKTNTICSTGRIRINADGVSGTVTLVSRDNNVELNGHNFNLTANYQGILAYSQFNGSGAVRLHGNSGTYVGHLMAPNGRLRIDGNYTTGSGGGVIAKFIEVNGANYQLTSGGNYVAGTPGITLSE